MNHLTRLQIKSPPLLMTLVLFCFGSLPKAQAVSPPPDGGYPGFNTAEGTNALKSLTTGVGDTAVGWFSLFSNTDGSFNTAVGAGTLLFNVGDQSTGEGVSNTAVGTAALLFNTTGSSNTAVGVSALLSNTNSNNTAIGRQALTSNTIGFENTAIGAAALFSNTDGGFNTAIGEGALIDSTGSSNIALGFSAGTNLTTGDSNIDIGNPGVAGESNTIRIGNDVVHTDTFIAGIFGATSSGGTAVFINSDGKLGSSTSSRRFKEEIEPMEHASEPLFALEPVTFRYRKAIDPAGTSQFGLVAEDVEKVNPQLVVRDKEGKPYSVRYDQVNAMLLNEFLKEHKAFLEERRKVEKLEATVSRQQKQIEDLAAGLEKVSNQIELSRSAPQTALNNQ
jgi:hypothetical protein